MCGERCALLCSQWRYWIRPVVITLYAGFIFGLLPYIVYRLVQTGVQSSTFAWLIGGIFVVLTIPISIWEIVQHLVNYTKPKLQKHIIRILWMVPIYSLDAWIVLWQPDLGRYLDTARECYEAYVIYNFMMFLLNFLEDEMDIETAMELKPTTHHSFPLCCMKSWPMGREFLHRCKHGILQYTVFHLMTTAISFILGFAGIYREGNFAPNNAFVYLFVVNNLSQFVAMYCLVLFYRAMKEELSPMKPLAKFLCIKCVVFFSFFQGVLIMFLVKAGLITEVFGISDENELHNISNVLQNFLICVEMFLAAVVHHYAFSYKPYVDADFEGSNCCHAFCLIWDISDVSSDFREHVHVVRHGVQSNLAASRSGGKYTGGREATGSVGSERTRLISPEIKATESHKSRRLSYRSTSESDRDSIGDLNGDAEADNRRM